MNQQTLLARQNAEIHFPEIAHLYIPVNYHKVEDGYFEYESQNSNFFIYVDPEMEKAPLIAIIGGLSTSKPTSL